MKIYKISEFAQKVGYHYKSLQVLDQKGIFKALKPKEQKQIEDITQKKM